MIKVKEFITDYKLKHDKAPTKKRILKEFEGVSEAALLTFSAIPLCFI